MRNLEIGAQFSDSKNAQRNLKIAQIPRLRGTYIFLHVDIGTFMELEHLHYTNVHFRSGFHGEAKMYHRSMH